MSSRHSATEDAQDLTMRVIAFQSASVDETGFEPTLIGV